MDRRALYRQFDLDFLREQNGLKPCEPPMDKISEYIEDRRILPPDAPYAGFWRNDFTPYSIEIMDNMAPSSAIQGQALMKGVQVGATSIAENVMAYWMDEYPGPIIYVTATQDLLKRWSKRLEPLIDSCGFRHKMVSQAGAKGTRRSGDKQFSKEYPGGSLDMSSAQSPASLRSDSKRVAIGDEIDGAPVLLTTGEGNYWKVALARLNAFGDRAKSFCLSTPTTYDDSLIYKEYMAGDQRHFMVPCPFCGREQFLEWGDSGATKGITPITTAGVLENVVYTCQFCHEGIENHHKTEMLRAGRWEPMSVVGRSRYFRSYWLPALYSPVGMLSWRKAYEQYQEAQETPDGMRSFKNHVEGLPFREEGSRPEIDKVVELRGNYRENTVPMGVIFLTGGIDVQRGSEKDPNNPPRIELEVCGHGLGYRSWSICYKRFEGPVDDPRAGAWKMFRNWYDETKFQFKRQDGLTFYVMLWLVDSGDGEHTETVYQFCHDWKNTFPSKGFRLLTKKKRDELGDERDRYNYDRYRKKPIGTDTFLYEISTNHYKTIIYRNLKVRRRDEGGDQRVGFCEFPVDYGSRYFEMLTAEELRVDGSYHAGGRRNEALDCRVLCMAGHDIVLETEVFIRREYAKQQGANMMQLAEIRKRSVLEEWARQTAPRRLVSA